MLQDLITELNGTKGARFVGFKYTNKFGEVAQRVIQVNTVYTNALLKDLHIIDTVDYIENEDFTEETFDKAKSALLKSVKLSLMKLGAIENDGSLSKEDIEKHANRSNGQSENVVNIGKNVQYNSETTDLYIFAKEVSKKVLVEGTYPVTNKRTLTKAKDYIRKSMKSSKYRKYVVRSSEIIKVNGQEFDL